MTAFNVADREPDVWTVDEVAARLRVSEHSVRRLIAADKLRVLRIGNRVRITEAQVQAYMGGQS